MIIGDTFPAYSRLVHDPDPQRLRELVDSDIGRRVQHERIAHQWDDIIERLVSDWHVRATMKAG